MHQEVQFCRSADGVRIAYAVSGSGPPLIKAANWLSHLEFDWESPVWRHWLRELSRHHTLIRYDERGCGLSDWDVEDFSVDAWVRDLETVVEATECERFALLGISQGGPVALSYAARHPERVERLVLHGTFARGWRLQGEQKAQEGEHLVQLARRGWGRQNPAFRQLFTGLFMPGANEEQIRSFNDLQRISTSPENAVRFLNEFGSIDVTEVLPRVRAPALVLHSRRDAVAPFEEGRRVAAEIPDSRFVALDSENHILVADEPAWKTFVAEVRRFLEVPEGLEDDAGKGAEGAAAAAAGAEGGEPHAEPTGEAPDLLTRLKRRKVGQWGLAYVAAAWAALEGLSVVAGPWGIPDVVHRALQLGIAAGLPITLVLAWYHGEQGRQRVSGAELLILALLLAIAGALMAVLSG